ncbi:hypothetical protein [Treponema zioleckii]|uniref:hypothetical protein n=1 Tax=Treponema zioleckii TaxID=331680 RepID=UPI00168BD38D|nr:hypothetical protein [Treponema zioleckii]
MSNNQSGENIFQKLFGSFFHKNDPEAEKKRKLKAIAKTLSKTKYKFYKAGSDQILPQLGKFFFEIYKLISPTQLMFQNQQNPNAFKTLVVDYSLSEEQKKIVDELSEESIKTISASMEFDKLKQKVKSNLDTLSSDFSQDKIREIDDIYSKLMSFRAFCLFDFYFMLKKFDSSLKEREFNKTMKFNPIDASYIADDLKDFLAITWAMPLNKDWSDMMGMFKAIKGVEPIKPAVWNKLMNKLEQMRSANVFEMIIQLTTKDPTYFVSVEEKREQIVETYIEKIRLEATNTIRKLEAEQKDSKIDSIATQIFNTSAITALKYYTDAKSAIFVKKNLGRFEYTKALNYMKAFLLEYVKRDVRDYADLVLIRGKWGASPLSKAMSEAFHTLLENSDKITTFDGKLSEEGGEYGTKLKTLLPRSDRDKEAANIIKTTLRDCNSIAKEFVVNSTKNLIVFAKGTKDLVEDYKKARPELITNWKELDRFAENPIQELAVEVYKKIYLMVNLMQGLLQN